MRTLYAIKLEYIRTSYVLQRLELFNGCDGMALARGHYKRR